MIERLGEESSIKRKFGLTDKKEKDEQTELPHRGLQSTAKYLEAFTVPGQLEYPEHPDEPDDS